MSDELKAIIDAARAAPTATDAELQIREQMGGNRIYIGKAPTYRKTLRLAAAVAAGLDLQTAFDRAGVRRRWGFVLLNRRG